MTFAGLMRLNVWALVVLGATAIAARAANDVNDYPTAARAEYVFGCIKANGETRQAIEQCSCSIDVVASLLPYDRYITAETVLSMAQVQGNLGGQFRSSEQANTALNDLRRAQAEAEVISRRIRSRNCRPSIRSGTRGPQCPWPRRGNASRHWERR